MRLLFIAELLWKLITYEVTMDLWLVVLLCLVLPFVVCTCNYAMFWGREQRFMKRERHFPSGDYNYNHGQWEGKAKDFKRFVEDRVKWFGRHYESSSSYWYPILSSDRVFGIDMATEARIMKFRSSEPFYLHLFKVLDHLDLDILVFEKSERWKIDEAMNAEGDNKLNAEVFKAPYEKIEESRKKHYRPGWQTRCLFLFLSSVSLMALAAFVLVTF